MIWNVENLSNASLPDAKIATHTEYSQRVESCLDRKRVLYEQVLLKEITLEEYKAQKADVDAELKRLRPFPQTKYLNTLPSKLRSLSAAKWLTKKVSATLLLPKYSP